MTSNVALVEKLLPALLGDVDQAEKVMLEQEQADCPVRHIFGPGVYIREVTLPADALCIGHYQNWTHINIMLTGKVKIYNQDGTSKILQAPMVFVGQPGRKIGYVIEKCVWQNVYATDEQDVEKLEQKYLTKTPYSEEWFKQRLLSSPDKYQADRQDYEKVLEELHLTEEQVQQEVQKMDDRSELPNGQYKFAVGPSSIHGKGVFATAPINSREVIGFARLNGKRTVLGTTVNHNKEPNAKCVRQGNDVLLVAVKNISGMKAGMLGEEITTDYRVTVSLIRAIELEKTLCLE